MCGKCREAWELSSSDDARFGQQFNKKKHIAIRSPNAYRTLRQPGSARPRLKSRRFTNRLASVFYFGGRLHYVTSRFRIAIVNSSSFGHIVPSHLERLKSFADLSRIQVSSSIGASELGEKIGKVDGILASVSPRYPRELLEAMPSVRIITRHGIGCDNIDLAAATELGIVVTKVAGPVEREAVAEQAIALLLTAARRTINGDTASRSGRWEDRAKFTGIELKDRTVGVVGVGNIGSRVVEILRYGFGSKVLAVDPAVSAEAMQNMGAEKTTLERLIAESDVISLNCSLNQTSRNILNRERISSLRRGVFIVNTARGELIDEESMIEALKSGHVAGYAADVVADEPDVPATHPLFSAPNMLLVPHLGAYTIESLRGMGEKMVADMETVLLKKAIPEVLANPEVLDSPALRI